MGMMNNSPEQQPSEGQPVPPNYVPSQRPQQLKKNFFTRKVGCVPMWVLIVAILVIFGIIANAANNANTASTTASTDISNSNQTTDTTTQQTQASVPTDTPTPAPQFVTIQTFTGNGTKKTGIFQVGNDWKIIWSCDPSSFATEYNLIVSVMNSDNSDFDLAAVNTLCKPGNTNGVTEEHQSGNVYLDVDSEGAWKIQIQNLQ
jgi:hypothetical protein